ncbi:MAG: protease inhibitor I42 family protein [bacterium]|nr:protease inhibitor I42 family protein [bacterium]
MSRLFVSVLFLALLSICSFSIASEPGTALVTEADNGKTVEVAKGSFLVIELPGQPGTGYSWQLAEYDKRLLEFVGKNLREPEQGYPNMKTVEIFRLKAKKKDSCVVELEYRRPFGKQKSPTRSFRVTVRIH